MQNIILGLTLTNQENVKRECGKPVRANPKGGNTVAKDCKSQTQGKIVQSDPVFWNR